MATKKRSASRKTKRTVRKTARTVSKAKKRAQLVANKSNESFRKQIQKSKT